jgi:N-acetyl-anhydromuramyl-L-alanine amidase AmpD
VADNPTRVKGLATEITPLVRLNTHVPHYRGTVARLPSRRRGIAYETESWPYVPASQYRKWTAGGRRPVRLVVIHDMEFPETARAAEVIAHDFATRTAKNPGSAHINVDNDSIVQCVKDNDIAFAAPGANRDGIQIELAGFGSQTREQWLDNYSEALLQRGADAAAQYCLKYGIPPIHITNQQLAAGAKGIIGHYQATAVYHESTHTDPGNAFPWDYFISLVGRAFERRKYATDPTRKAGQERLRATGRERLHPERYSEGRDLGVLPIEPRPRRAKGRLHQGARARSARGVRAARRA